MSKFETDKVAGNKNGNDINVDNIEKYIKQLEYLLFLYRDDTKGFSGKYPTVGEIFEKDFIAIEKILEYYTRQKQINEEHKKEKGLLREKVKELEEENEMLRKSNNIAKDVKIEDITQLINKSYKEFMNGFIPKQKIKDKIDEIIEDKDSKYYYEFLEFRDIQKTIDILSELLKEEEK